MIIELAKTGEVRLRYNTDDGKLWLSSCTCEVRLHPNDWLTAGRNYERGMAKASQEATNGL